MSKILSSIFALIAVVLVTLATPLAAKADPPPWAPAHGWRSHHRDWDHDHDGWRWRHRGWNDHDADDAWRYRGRQGWNGYQSNTAPYYGNYNNGYNPYTYNSNTPVPYNGQPSLIYAQQSAQAQYNAAIARGDTNGAKHYANALAKINAQLSALGYSGNAGAYYNGYTGVSPFAGIFQGFFH